MIERLTDTDAFSFTVTTAGQYLIDADPDAPSGLDPKLSVYDSSGVLLAVKDGDPLARHYDQRQGTEPDAGPRHVLCDRGQPRELWRRGGVPVERCLV